ncbi:hypothetical protein BGZ65_001016, partial [Modicella reniformis]
HTSRACPNKGSPATGANSIPVQAQNQAMRVQSVESGNAEVSHARAAIRRPTTRSQEKRAMRDEIPRFPRAERSPEPIASSSNMQLDPIESQPAVAEILPVRAPIAAPHPLVSQAGRPKRVRKLIVPDQIFVEKIEGLT